MTLRPAARKLVLALHLTTSVGWLGAVIAYVALDVTVAISQDPGAVRGAWTAMGTLAAWVLMPLAVAALASGLLLAFGTRWGLFRHWWVVVSLVLTTVAVVVLIIETSVIGSAAALALAPATPDATVLAIPATLPHSVGGLIVLLVVQWLNVYKPEGLTP